MSTTPLLRRPCWRRLAPLEALLPFSLPTLAGDATAEVKKRRLLKTHGSEYADDCSRVRRWV